MEALERQNVRLSVRSAEFVSPQCGEHRGNPADGVSLTAQSMEPHVRGTSLKFSGKATALPLLQRPAAPLPSSHLFPTELSTPGHTVCSNYKVLFAVAKKTGI